MQLHRESCNNADEVSELSKALGNVTIVKKGPHDLIASAESSELWSLYFLTNMFTDFIGNNMTFMSACCQKC